MGGGWVMSRGGGMREMGGRVLSVLRMKRGENEVRRIMRRGL